MKVREITDALEAFAPLSIQESWDNSGLCIGSGEDPVSGVLIGFDCTPELIDEAIAAGCNLVVTHHPLIFKGLKQINADDPVGEAVVKAIRGGVAVYAAHTTADKVIAGVSGAMARRLGLQDIEILTPEEGGTGLGTVGNLPEPLAAEDFIALVKERFGLQVVRTSRLIEKPVSRVAMCGGAGASEIAAARRSGAQAYLSGDISYHNFFTPKDFLVLDIGHFESEVDIVDILFEVLRKNFPNFAVRRSDTVRRSNPVHYH